MRFDIITIFPRIFDSYLNESILARAQKAGLIEIAAHDLRDYTSDKHRTVDDSPYGGGVGMVMLVEPIYKAIKSLSSQRRGLGEERGSEDNNSSSSKPSPPHQVRGKLYPLSKGEGTRIILLSPRGERLTQEKIKQLATYHRLILIAGRYEGVDERVAEFTDEQISIGDFVLAGGEVAAMVIIEAVSRLIPGVLGKDESSKEESFSDADSTEYPHYTRPEVFITEDGQELKVPEVLLSGHHAEIGKWRKKQRKF